MKRRFRIRTEVDSRPPFDGERYWKWEVYAYDSDELRIFAMGWRHTKAEAVQLARFVRAELSR